MNNTTTKLPEHFFVSSTDGGLYDTRKADWHRGEPVRARYQWAHLRIETVGQLKATLRTGYVWPGGYELVYVTSDGALLCAACVRKEFRSVVWSVRHQRDDGWRVVGCGYEATSAEAARECDPELVSPCEHCGREFGEIY